MTYALDAQVSMSTVSYALTPGVLALLAFQALALSVHGFKLSTAGRPTLSNKLDCKCDPDTLPPLSYLISINDQPHITRTDHKLAILDLDSLMTHRRR